MRALRVEEHQHHRLALEIPKRNTTTIRGLGLIWRRGLDRRIVLGVVGLFESLPDVRRSQAETSKTFGFLSETEAQATLDRVFIPPERLLLFSPVFDETVGERTVSVVTASAKTGQTVG
jgi:hypothetical protein